MCRLHAVRIIKEAIRFKSASGSKTIAVCGLGAALIVRLPLPDFSRNRHGAYHSSFALAVGNVVATRRKKKSKAPNRPEGTQPTSTRARKKHKTSPEERKTPPTKKTDHQRASANRSTPRPALQPDAMSILPSCTTNDANRVPELSDESRDVMNAPNSNSALHDESDSTLSNRQRVDEGTFPSSSSG